jgi:hypothetical protein
MVLESSLKAMHISSLETWLTYLNIAASAVLIARLYGERLARIYRVLVLYLAADLLEGVLTLVFASSNRARLFIYIGGQAVKVTIAVFVAMELFRLALVQQPALARWGKQAIGYFCAAAAAVVAVFYLLVGTTARVATFQFVVGWFLKFESGMDFAVLIILVLMSIFLIWFPVRARRNTALCIAGFVVYSFQRWTGLLLIWLWPVYRTQSDTAMLFLSLACFTAWVVLLSRQGENSTVVTGHRWNPLEAARLTGQLDAINARLAAR